MNLPEPKILTHQFLQTMRMRNCSERTIASWQYILKRFISWCDERSIDCMSEITPDHIAAYRRSLFHYRNPKTGKALTFDTQAHYLMPVRRWFNWMTVQVFIEIDPTTEIELPKSENRLPTSVLTADQVETLLNVPDITTPLGLRDRASWKRSTAAASAAVNSSRSMFTTSVSTAKFSPSGKAKTRKTESFRSARAR